MKLYCGQNRRWESIVVDDQIPVKKGTTTPIFAKPHGEELWVALLEKAFAKVRWISRLAHVTFCSLFTHGVLAALSLLTDCMVLCCSPYRGCCVALAQFVGNYHKLDGGFAIWGLQAMTGDEVANWMLEEGSWKAYDIRYRQTKGQKGVKADDIPLDLADGMISPVC